VGSFDRPVPFNTDHSTLPLEQEIWKGLISDISISVLYNVVDVRSLYYGGAKR